MNHAKSKVANRNSSNVQPITQAKARTAKTAYRKPPDAQPLPAETIPAQAGTVLTDMLFDQTRPAKAALDRVRTALTQAGFTLSAQGIAALKASRTAALAQHERLEFGMPPMGVIAEKFATSPFLLQENLSNTLAETQECFYRLRDEIDLSFTDEELAWALAQRFDAVEGDLETLCATEAADISALLDDGASEQDESSSEYRIVDDAGTEYAFRPQEWEYDEFAPGWDGEKWSDGFDE